MKFSKSFYIYTLIDFSVYEVTRSGIFASGLRAEFFHEQRAMNSLHENKNAKKSQSKLENEASFHCVFTSCPSLTIQS